MIFHFPSISLAHQRTRNVPPPSDHPPKTKSFPAACQWMRLIPPLKKKKKNVPTSRTWWLKFSNFSDGCFSAKALTDKPLKKKEYTRLREKRQQKKGKKKFVSWNNRSRTARQKKHYREILGAKQIIRLHRGSSLLAGLPLCCRTALHLFFNLAAFVNGCVRVVVCHLQAVGF